MRLNLKEKFMSVTMRQMLEAGVHFGHQTRSGIPRWLSIFLAIATRSPIINLEKTLAMYQEAMNYVRQLAANKGNILFVGTKRQARDIVHEEATRCGPLTSTSVARWNAHQLQNDKTIRKTPARHGNDGEDGTLDKLSKKEALDCSANWKNSISSLGASRT